MEEMKRLELEQEDEGRPERRFMDGEKEDMKRMEIDGGDDSPRRPLKKQLEGEEESLFIQMNLS